MGEHLLTELDSQILLSFDLSKLPETSSYLNEDTGLRRVVVKFPIRHPSKADIHHEATHAALAVMQGPTGSFNIICGGDSEESFVSKIDEIAEAISGALNKRNWYANN